MRRPASGTGQDEATARHERRARPAPRGHGGCLYTAKALHSTVEEAQSHEAMGFSQGWGVVLDQLVEYVKTTPMA
jgi:uncharacterized protein YndB with AHSA1/START domain